ncbi:Ubiquitin carboxyl-terminal hydrolase [uncultured virus]|nr:Ubiquitin carboxyl-terminal hydrolase [uncultured virus]
MRYGLKFLEINHFIVENAINTCYIDSLLMALFYNPSIIGNLLNSDCKEGMSIYLQEYIRTNFVEYIQQNKSVLENTMNMIRILSIQNGWINGKSSNMVDSNINRNYYDNIFDQQDVTEYYNFLINIFNGPQIEIQRQTITEGLPDENDIGKIEKLPFIPLSIPDNIQQIDIKELYHNWVYDNCSNIKRMVPTANGKEERSVLGLNTYHITNIPYIIGFQINRFKEENKKNYANIIIQKKIHLFMNSSNPFHHEWIFHAAICHKGETIKSGHYYTLLSINSNFYIFDDQKIPCIELIDMADKKVTNLIKKECFFIIYKYNN